MLRRIVAALILVPLAVVIIAFAVANRQTVTVAFDPFDAAHPAYAASLPLFALIFLAVILGALIGGFAAWLRQSRWRRAARRLDLDLRELRAEIEALRRRLNETEPLPRAVEAPPPLVIPPPVA